MGPRDEDFSGAEGRKPARSLTSHSSVSRGTRPSEYRNPERARPVCPLQASPWVGAGSGKDDEFAVGGRVPGVSGPVIPVRRRGGLGWLGS